MSDSIDQHVISSFREQASISDNKSYTNDVLQLIDALQPQIVFDVVCKNKLDLGTNASAEREKNIQLLTEALHKKGSGLVKSVSGTGVGSYIYNLLAIGNLTAESLPQFLRDNDKHFNDICFQLAGLNQWFNHKAKMENSMAVLQYALLDAKLSKKLYNFGKVCEKDTRLNKEKRYKMIAVGQLNNGNIDQAIEDYKQAWGSGEIWFLNGLISQGYIDKAINFVLENEDFRKNLNGSKNWQFQSLSRLFSILVEADPEKAIAFITNDAITKIRYGNDVEYFINTMHEKSVDSEIVIKYFESDNVYTKKRNVGPMAGVFEKVGEKFGADFLVRALTANDNAWAKVIIGVEKSVNLSPDEIVNRVKGKYSSFLSSCFD